MLDDALAKGVIPKTPGFDYCAGHSIRPLGRGFIFPQEGAISTGGEAKANMLFALMAVRTCRVTIQDLDGITHTVEVTTESLFDLEKPRVYQVSSISAVKMEIPGNMGCVSMCDAGSRKS